jgi:glycyl-tRNA synthetase alpha chain
VFDLAWNGSLSYGEISHQNEVEFSHYNFERADTDLLFHQFTAHETEANRLLEAELPLPAYDQCLKCSHVFNMLDARHAISVTERARYIGRVRDLAKACAEGYLSERERLGYPLLEGRAS